MEELDWEHLFDDNTPAVDDLNFFDFSFEGLRDLSSDPMGLSVDEIEQLLMNDDDVDKAGDVAVPIHEFSNEFLSDILVDSPVGFDGSGGGEVVDVSDGRKSTSPEEDEVQRDVVDVEIKENNNSTTDDGEEEEEEEDDPISKKRKRQKKNRDAAVRSRERKKLYVRDLEMKSRYFEGECRRLGILYNCVLAENQALRLSLQNIKASDASMAKQESAVLLLESLLLGSLLWFLGTMCLLILPESVRSTVEEVPLENVDNQNLGRVAPRKTGSKIYGVIVFHSSKMGKSCKASRSRMKPSYLIPEVLA